MQHFFQNNQTLQNLLAVFPINTIQEGYLNDPSWTATEGSGEDGRYLDITISTVDTSKSITIFEGYALYPVATGSIEFTVTGEYFMSTTSRLTSSTNLRIACIYPGTSDTHIVGRWKVVEFT